MLTTDSAARKNIPLHSGCYAYFPDALAAVAKLSKAGNDKHNPGQPLHWSRDKSNDHADCIARHVQDAGPDFMGLDADGTLHVVQSAWRALALAQVVLECIAAGKPFNPSGYKAAPAAEPEWIEWKGGKMPVPGDVTVDVKFRDAEFRFLTRQAAGLYTWRQDGGRDDIIAYKVAAK